MPTEPAEMLTFLCGVCQTQLQTPTALAGKLVSCPKCKTTLRAPTSAGTPDNTGTVPPIPRHPPMPSRPLGGKRYGFNCQYCSSRLETTEGQAGQEGACPTCGNAIIIPILDRYGRLIDPMTGKVIKQDPHPVHAYAAAGERAPKIIRREDGNQSILCPKCRTQSTISANNCKQCGMPFTMEGTTAEASGATNGAAVASLVLGIIGIPTCMLFIFSGIALILGFIGRHQAVRDNGGAGQGVAIAGIVLGAIGLAIGAAVHSGLF